MNVQFCDARAYNKPIGYKNVFVTLKHTLLPVAFAQLVAALSERLWQGKA